MMSKEENNQIIINTIDTNEQRINQDITKYLPNYIFTSIYDGLKETIEYFENNYNIVRK